MQMHLPLTKPPVLFNDIGCIKTKYVEVLGFTGLNVVDQCCESLEGWRHELGSWPVGREWGG